MTKTALVTGAARGIGLAAAKRFLADGWRVALLDMNTSLVGHAHHHCHILIKAGGADSAFSVRGERAPLTDESAVLVVTSGDRRVDEKKVSALVGPVGRADADFVKAKTGFAIGGVSPVAHLNPPVTLLDQDLWRFDEIWAAAGHPHGVFRLQPEDLKQLTGAPVADVVVAP